VHDDCVIGDAMRDVFFDNAYPQDIDVLFVGRTEEPRKRFELGLEAVRAWNPNAVVVAAGMRSQRLPESSNLKYAGFVSDSMLNTLYNRSKYLMFPSEFEGLGLPPIEAMICGVPVVACSDCEAIQDYMPPQFIAEPTVESLVEKLKYIEFRYAEIVQNLLNKTAPSLYMRYNKIAIAKKYIKVYQKYS
jgi:glycosyltransferase involved in cell wall biosynthesis